MVHTIETNNESFESIASGEETIKYYLNDEQKRKIFVGDRIVFNNVTKDRQQVVVLVNGKYIAHTFSELRTKLFMSGIIEFQDFEPQKMIEYYSKEEEYKEGVVALSISLISDIFQENDISARFVNQFHKVPVDVIINYVSIEFEHDKHSNKGAIEAKKILNGGRYDTVSGCGFARSQKRKYEAQRLKRVFSDNSIGAMAYYIKYIDGTITENELRDNLPKESAEPVEDVERLLNCTKSILHF